MRHLDAPCIADGSNLSLKVGDTVALEIDGLGRLENPVAAEA